MTENIASTVNEIAQSLGMASTEIIPHYARWYFARSVGFMLMGLILVGLGIFFSYKIWDKEDDESQLAAIVILAIGVFVGLVFICLNIGDFVSPEGIAYHRLISDIRGN